MIELWVGLLAWLGVAVLVGVLLGRFMRLPQADDAVEAPLQESGLAMLPGYGWEGEEGEGDAAGQPMPEANQRCGRQ